MIAVALRLDVERYAAEVRSRNPLFTGAAAGTLTPQHVARYLENLRQLIAHTTYHLGLARDGARRLGHEELAIHYQRRILEEAGHEAWAEDDLRALAPKLTAPPPRRMLASMAELVAYVEARVTEEPALYLAYALFAEYLTVIIGPDWLRALEEHCGVERRSMSVIANHVELDRGHVEDALEEIDRLVGDPKMLTPMREMVRGAILRFEAFCEEVTRDEPQLDAERAREQASAA